jgi:hypothetical protein
MFVQVINARVEDPQPVHEAMDRWAREVASGAEGWLGTTAGVTDDGRFVALARFESEEAAQRNSQRPEQDRWWSEFSQLLTGGQATFHDSEWVIPDVVGNPDEAHFVQVMQGHGHDPDRARELMSHGSEKWSEFRPDILGSLAVAYDRGDYTMAIYFTNEEEAREGEKKEPPPELQAEMAEMDALSDGPPDFFDIKEPWLYSARH